MEVQSLFPDTDIGWNGKSPIILVQSDQFRWKISTRSVSAVAASQKVKWPLIEVDHKLSNERILYLYK